MSATHCLWHICSHMPRWQRTVRDRAGRHAPAGETTSTSRLSIAAVRTTRCPSEALLNALCAAPLLQTTKQNAGEAGLDIVNEAGMVREEHQKSENMNFHADNFAILTLARRAWISSTRHAPVPRLAAALKSLNFLLHYLRTQSDSGRLTSSTSDGRCLCS